MVNKHFVKFFFGFIGIILLGLFGVFLMSHIGSDNNVQIAAPIDQPN